MFMYGALLFFVLISAIKAALVNQRSDSISFKQCLINSPTSLGYCLGIGALSKLQSIDSDPEFDVVDGLTFSRDDQQVRDSYNSIDRNPKDFRSIVDSIGDVFSRRFLKWDMGFIYPGLMMRVAPSLSPAGVLEFVMDPHREAHSLNALKEATTGQLVARQFLLPFLVGFKFNVAALIPIIFGLIALIAKKALLLSKVGLILSTMIGLSSLLFGNKYPGQVNSGYPGYGGVQFHNPGPGFSGNYGYAPHNRYPDEDYFRDPIYRESDAQTEENQVRFFNSEDSYARADKSNGRNFAWNDDEKKQKKKA